MVEVWPSILVPSVVEFQLVPSQGFGPRSTFGVQQVISTDRGYWRASLSSFNIRTPDQIREWRAVIASLSGSLGEVLIGPFDCKNSPRDISGPSILSGIPFSDDTYFSDGAGWSQSTAAGIVTFSRTLRSTEAVVTITSPGSIRRGMYFSIRKRLYIVTLVLDTSSTRVSIRFSPPLRSDIAAGESVDFSRPQCLMRLASTETGSLSLRMGRFSDPTVELEESPLGL